MNSTAKTVEPQCKGGGGNRNRYRPPPLPLPDLKISTSSPANSAAVLGNILWRQRHHCLRGDLRLISKQALDEQHGRSMQLGSEAKPATWGEVNANRTPKSSVANPVLQIQEEADEA